MFEFLKKVNVEPFNIYKERDRMIGNALTEGKPVQVSKSGSVLIGGINEMECLGGCGSKVQQRTMWFSGEGRPPVDEFGLCDRCISIQHFNRNRLLKRPYKIPCKRPQSGEW